MELLISKAALTDLEDIWLYTYQKWSKDQADRYYELLIAECEYVTRNFEHGKNMDFILSGYRSSQVKSHLIFYKLNQEGNVEIIRILHQMTDIKNRF
ncbi:type II toxin-antitoxin system RelE/ParE family toxin [Pedobacter petrophilus]|uniref:Toxin n=1 Tax=Pedobacter petrophilus TaxID=1908241 RepID=A0A7K0G1T3_9SPHI|nr:type II toxin-antitoxin system RelE/ParE family toxin [Pedobacter petrophilus]